MNSLVIHSLQFGYYNNYYIYLFFLKPKTTISYMILAPALMTNEKDPKKAAAKCFESIGLDPESYRIGHTKARKKCPPLLHIKYLLNLFLFCDKYFWFIFI